MNTNIYCNRDQAAAELGVCRRTLDGWRASGQGPAWFRIGNQIRYLKPSVMEFKKRQSVEVAVSGDYGLPDLPLFSGEELRSMFGMSARTLAYWIARGTAPQITHIDGRRMYARHDVIAFLASQNSNKGAK
jgi:predicted DNA-binding transcriptional regulator AlpA